MTADQFTWNVRVYYEDTDTAGVVYYANYLRFFERARTEWLRHRGLNQEKLAAEEGLRFVVRRVTLDFIAAARLDAERIAECAGTSFSGTRSAAASGCAPEPRFSASA